MEFGFGDILQLLGALGLFLFGMKVMSDALLLLAGNKMRGILATMTSNRFLGISTGFLITSVIQSSSATTLMVVSFSNASLLTLTESISVIMGANIGTTITAWLITILGFKVSMSAIALPLVGFGFLFMFSKKENLKNWGGFIIGFAILFIGLQFLKEAMPNINENPEILQFLNRYADMGYGSILLFLFIGTILTVVIQSSSATMALTLIMTAEGWIPFELAAAMVLGENIGTTITANLAAIVANFQAKRTARAHLIFNIIGVVWMLILFYPFLSLISWLTQRLGSESPYLNAAAIPVAISLFHTVFNVMNTFLLVWFITPIAKIVEWVVPEKLELEREIDEPKYLNEKIAQFPETVIASLLSESKYLFQNAIFEIVTHALNIHREDIKSSLKAKKVVKKSMVDMKTDVRALYLSKVKTIYGEIIRYATNAQSTLKLSEIQNNRVLEIKVANRKMVEVIKDLRELNRNVTMYSSSPNTKIKNEYDNYRKLTVKVLREVYNLPMDETIETYQKILMDLRKRTNKKLKADNEVIDRLIREQLITTDMASSLVNDHDNVRNILNNLITVAELLYCRRDTLLIPKGDQNLSMEAVA
ncbi:Na/Pi cotransporter family protein [uncultured Muriicola sp.]|uniref:Na/Pi cotransporter family protein n=1 Tax=uncultured Muriicola sp. TaxID=1583102 RepID=UPI00262629D8|nr:Na/Pi cotransporter family protein [uncultured Muriicola sp.]